MDAAGTQLADVLSAEDAALGDGDPIGGQTVLQVQGCIQADLERLSASGFAFRLLRDITNDGQANRPGGILRNLSVGNDVH